MDVIWPHCRSHVKRSHCMLIDRMKLSATRTHGGQVVPSVEHDHMKTDLAMIGGIFTDPLLTQYGKWNFGKYKIR